MLEIAIDIELETRDTPPESRSHIQGDSADLVAQDVHEQDFGLSQKIAIVASQG
jgi:hypothetical protein